MALEKRLEVDQITIDPNGGPALIRFAKLIVDTDTGAEISRQWHRTSVEPGTSVDAQILAVSNDLARAERGGFPPVDMVNAKAQQARTVIGAAHTPAVIANYRAAQEARERRFPPNRP